jgi:hypothetical protein
MNWLSFMSQMSCTIRFKNRHVKIHLENNCCIFVWLSVKDGIFTFNYGETYNLCITNHMCSIGSRYATKSDKLNFVDFLIIQNHARSTKIRIEIEH